MPLPPPPLLLLDRRPLMIARVLGRLVKKIIASASLL